MMKKILLSLGLMGILGGFISFASANDTNCKEVEFSNGVTACVNIENVSTNRRRLTTSVDNGSTSSLRCDIMTPDSILRLRESTSCNQEFTYNGQ
ncbi:MAG TPA: hypothetical protein PKC87_04895, partial [Candidatus Absconditabacterales bacterium]|nr:hypothetical protein [Candidatus Absconditabacterales bacterium]